jgi:hypothetical protein
LPVVRCDNAGVPEAQHVEAVVGYGALLGVGRLALQWLDYQRLADMHSGGIDLRIFAAREH